MKTEFPAGVGGNGVSAWIWVTRSTTAGGNGGGMAANGGTRGGVTQTRDCVPRVGGSSIGGQAPKFTTDRVSAWLKNRTLSHEISRSCRA